VQDGVKDINQRSALKWPLTGEQFVEDAADRENVSGGTCREAMSLLWRHVQRGADQTSRTNERHRCSGLMRIASRIRRSGYAEIQQLYAVASQKHIRGFEVPVNDPEIVQSLERLQHLPHN
jgi:hypothetical protein